MLTGFRLVGVEGEEANTATEAIKALNRALARSDIAIIILSDIFASEPSVQAQVDKVRQERVTPMIVELPGSRGAKDNVKLSDTISKILSIKI